ncbi:MAG: hypothetical protein ACLR0U_10470 [Enterocloster clostridioformis]
MKMLKRVIRNYWLAEETNIFRNYRDALAGFVALVIIPAVSIFFVLFTDGYTFWSYTFPFISISLAGAYDTYGRYNGHSPQNAKLVIRLIFDFLAIFLQPSALEIIIRYFLMLPLFYCLWSF